MRDEIIEMIINKCASLYGKDASEYSEETKFTEDLNAKSVDLVKIIGELEDEFGLDINFMEFRRQPTIGAAADYVESLAD